MRIEIERDRLERAVASQIEAWKTVKACFERCNVLCEDGETRRFFWPPELEKDTIAVEMRRSAMDDCGLHEHDYFTSTMCTKGPARSIPGTALSGPGEMICVSFSRERNTLSAPALERSASSSTSWRARS